MREYINGFDPNPQDDHNADGPVSDTDAFVNASAPDVYDDTLGCFGYFGCSRGKFWQRFTVTILYGPGKGKQFPVLIKVNGKQMNILTWQNNGRSATTSLDFPSQATLPGASTTPVQ